MHKTILTFDIEGPPGREDFLIQEEVATFARLLRLLEKYQLKALLFISGTIADTIVNYPEVLELFRAHEIGYHSSSHSIKPRIFEYTDVKSYEKAVQISLERETSSINPFNGKIEGEGGIERLREIFPEKDIVSFRAPFWCWTPPHLEALRELGIKNDFSNTEISGAPFFYKGLIFFPESILIDGFQGKLSFFKEAFSQRAPNEEVTVVLMHPSVILVEQKGSLYMQYRNPFKPVQIKLRSPLEVESKFVLLEFILSSISLFQKAKLTEVNPSINLDDRYLNPTFPWKIRGEKGDIEKIYQKTMWVPVNTFGYNPKYLRSHFYRFFEE